MTEVKLSDGEQAIHELKGYAKELERRREEQDGQRTMAIGLHNLIREIESQLKPYPLQKGDAVRFRVNPEYKYTVTNDETADGKVDVFGHDTMTLFLDQKASFFILEDS